MKIALVHDYLHEFGGAERVLLALSQMFPEAPIYTAFCVPDSTAARAFAGKKIISSWFEWLPGCQYLYSPLRFLLPWIWGSFNLKSFDLIITSASWYVTKGLGRKFGVREICYCHTPPRWLYGYPTSVNFQRFWPVKVYATIVGHFLRMYDFKQAQKVDQFVANSREVANRIRKFYRREAIVVYPPVETQSQFKYKRKRGNYFLLLSRLVGGKGVALAMAVARQSKFKIKIAGEPAGFGKVRRVETLGYVSEEKKTRLMAQAKGFLALGEAEDFGITPVEAMQCGTPVIAFNGGGYKESVIDGKTGVLFDDYSVTGLLSAIERFNKLKWDEKVIKRQGQKFSVARFKREMLKLIKRNARTAGN